jgi:hypothetical protein
MPKKHTSSFTHTKPSYVHPSLQGSRSSTPSGPASPQTVNERIQQLRREQTPRATIEQRDAITEVATHRTIPPALRRILHMTEVDAPAPKPGSRRNVRTDLRPGARPPPGPAAPSSWLHQSRYAPKNIRKYMQGEGYGPQGFCKLARVHDADFKVCSCPDIAFMREQQIDPILSSTASTTLPKPFAPVLEGFCGELG